MRHLTGIALAVVMTGCCSSQGPGGYLQLLQSQALAIPLPRLPAGGGSLLSGHSVLAALIAVAGTSLLAGILIAVPRISPLAAGLPGLLLLGWTALYLASADDLGNSPVSIAEIPQMAESSASRRRG